MKKKSLRVLSLCSLWGAGAACVCMASHTIQAARADFVPPPTAGSLLSDDVQAPDGQPAEVQQTSAEMTDGASTSDEVTTSASSSSEVDAATEGESEEDVQANEEIGDVAGKITGTYFGIFYGPSVSKPTSYQPTENGIRDPNRPVMMKNFVGLGYNLTEHIRITPTAYWLWMPSAGGAYGVQDPFIRVSDDSIIGTDEFNLYGDVRYHAPVSNFSKAADINGSFQSVQVATYVPQGTRWLLGLFGSERVYMYGKKGYGNDFELYIGPNVGYQLAPKLQATVLYEANLAHVYGTNPGTLDGDGNDLQPGLSWDITPKFNFHPYLSIYPSNPSVKTTSVGALVYFQAF